MLDKVRGACSYLQGNFGDNRNSVGLLILRNYYYYTIVDIYVLRHHYARASRSTGVHHIRCVHNERPL